MMRGHIMALLLATVVLLNSNTAFSSNKDSVFSINGVTCGSEDCILQYNNCSVYVFIGYALSNFTDIKCVQLKDGEEYKTIHESVIKVENLKPNQDIVLELAVTHKNGEKDKCVITTKIDFKIDDTGLPVKVGECSDFGADGCLSKYVGVDCPVHGAGRVVTIEEVKEKPIVKYRGMLKVQKLEKQKVVLCWKSDSRVDKYKVVVERGGKRQVSTTNKVKFTLTKFKGKKINLKKNTYKITVTGYDVEGERVATYKAINLGC